MSVWGIAVNDLVCFCGAKLRDGGVVGELRFFSCSNKECGEVFQIPIGQIGDLGRGSAFVPAAVLPFSRAYSCRQCGASIGEEQALRTFGVLGRALCIGCEEAL